MHSILKKHSRKVFRECFLCRIDKIAESFFVMKTGDGWSSWLRVRGIERLISV